ncbi:hypothetical protein CsSME_00052711 [Camellia sinensis var. sinensis]
MAKGHKDHRKAPPPKKPNKTNEKVSGCATHASCNLRMLTETTIVDISANLSKEWSPRRKGENVRVDLILEF